MTARQRWSLLAIMTCLVLAMVAMTAVWGTPSTTRAQTGQPSITTSPDISEWVPRIAIAYDQVGRDSGFNELARDGAQRVVDAFEADFIEVTAEADDTDADLEERLALLAEARAGIVFVIGAAYAGPLANVAPNFPDTWFGIVDDSSLNEPNVVGILFNEEQGSFLVGAAAALTSKTGSVGFIGAIEIPVLQKYEAGFIAGARAADPDVEVQVAYLAQSPDDASRSDSTQAREAALRMYDAGADVVFAAGGDSGDGVILAARDRGLWAIGADSDQYQEADPSVRDVILTSMLKRADVATYTIGMEIAMGVPKDGNNVFGVGVGGIGYSTSGGFVDPIKAQLDVFAARIASGEILVPRTP